MHRFLPLLLALHGGIHFLGFAASLGYVPEGAALAMSWPWGVAWAAAAVLLLLAAGLLLLRRTRWWMVAAAGVAVSQFLIVTFWRDAAFGTLPNLLILVGMVLTLAGRRFYAEVARERRQLLSSARSTDVPSRTAERPLPGVVANWLRRSGAMDRTPGNGLYLQQQLRMKLKPDQQTWYPAVATQLFTAYPPAFHWAVTVRMHPLLTVYGQDRFASGRASLRMSVFNLFTVGQVAANPKVDEAAMQRYLAELVWYPEAAVSPCIQWEALDSGRARATLTLGRRSASGVFTFSPGGDFLRFACSRYREHGPEAERLPWIAEAEDWSEFNGVRLPSKLRASWIIDQQPWTWLKLSITDRSYAGNEILQRRVGHGAPD